MPSYDVEAKMCHAGKKLPDDMEQDDVPWKSLGKGEKLKRIFLGMAKAAGLVVLLYFFVCSLELLSTGFRILGGRTTGSLFRQSDIIKNPIVGVMIGVMATVFVQSSSTSTSIVVSMVAAEFITVKQAIPVVMGANIGTSVTNTIVSLMQAGDRDTFRRAFAGATVHDMFNWLSVIVMLVIEVTTHYLYHFSNYLTAGLASKEGSTNKIELLKKLTKPLTKLIVQIDKSVLKCWSTQNCTKHDNSSLIKYDCSKHSENITDEATPCGFLFAKFGWSDPLVGGILVAASLAVLCTCLILIVKLLNSVLKGKIAVIVKKVLNAQIPHAGWLTGYLAILVGAVMTFLVQSSSVFTSALTPLVGIGLITVETMYPLTLGSNIGTTTTALLASLAAEGSHFRASLQIALCHILFNISGILIFYPIPFMRFPIRMAKFLGKTTAKYRWFAIVYMILMFIVCPALFMGLSFLGTWYVIVFSALILLLAGFVVTINAIRSRRPQMLPAALKNWKWLPVWLRSLEPYDRILSKLICCKKFKASSQSDIAMSIPPKSQSIDKSNGNVNRAYVEAE